MIKSRKELLFNVLSWGLFLVTTVLYYLNNPAPHTAYDFGRVWGELFGFVGIAYLLASLLKRIFSRKSKLFKFVVFSVIFFILVMGSIGGTSGASDERLKGLSNNLTAEMKTIANNYNDVVSKNDFSPVFKAENLKNEETLKNTQKQIKNIKAALSKYEEASKRFAETGVAARVSTSGLSILEKRGFMEGYNSKKEATLQKTEQYFSTEREFLDTVDKYVAFLLEHRDKYSISGGNIVFQSQSDLDQYNQFVKKINDLSEKKKQLSATSFDL